MTSGGMLRRSAAAQGSQSMHTSTLEPPDAIQEREIKRQKGKKAYQVSAVTTSAFITAVAVGGSLHRCVLSSERITFTEAALALLTVFGGMVLMEGFARWSHRYLWHDSPLSRLLPLRIIPFLHETHHTVRTFPFQANDSLAVVNAVPAIAACAWGFFTPGLSGALVFSAGLGVTIYGMSYMFVHDGLIHRRFPVGNLAEVPYLRRVAMAHKLHHTNALGGVPFGLFLGPQEVEKAGGKDLLDRMCDIPSAASG
eukprot:jgi/Botrbrau1/3360/Bobra.0337s0001.1